MSHTNFFVEKMQLSEINEVATILTDAFETNEAYSLIFSETKKVKEGLLWLFKTNLYLINHKNVFTHLIKEKNSDKIIGTYSLLPPEGAGNSLFAYMKIGIPQFISNFGLRTLIKMMKMDDINKKTLQNSMGINQYYYLSMVVIKEEYRGSGIGSFAIRNCLESLSMVERKSDYIGLTTQLPENVSFYSKLGFEKIDEGEIKFKKEGYYNYNMKHTFYKKY